VAVHHRADFHTLDEGVAPTTLSSFTTRRTRRR
jgi:hypothetical protein